MKSGPRPHLHAPSAPAPAPQSPPSDILALARADTVGSVAELDALPAPALADAVLALPARSRAEFLELSDRVGELVPLLPEAEFASTVVAAGVADAGWLVAHASGEQKLAALDLDCWKGGRFSPSRACEWLDAMIEAGGDTLAAALEELDLELWVLLLKSMAQFSAPGAGLPEDDELVSLDGVVFYEPTSSENEERLRAVLGTAMLETPSLYWALVYGALAESRLDCEEQAARWHGQRLGDLGFPEPAQAMRAYKPLRPEQFEIPVVELEEEGAAAAQAGAGSAWLPQPLEGTLVGRALSELPPERSAALLAEIFSVANALAVADELDLAEPDSVPGSLRKAVRGIERGLLEMMDAHDQPLRVVADRIAPMDLFRIGATAGPGLLPRRSLRQLWQEGEPEDWNVQLQEVELENQTLDADGRLRR